MKNGITTVKPLNGGTPKYIATDTLNAELVKKGVYDSIMQKHILSYLGIRNSAAHGRDQEYTVPQVESMIKGVKDFLDTYPA